MPTEEETSGKLSVSEISVSFGGITALDGVSLEVSQGEVLGVIGPNGAGKTTLFNVICGFVTPASGTMRWRGQPLDGIRPHQLASLGIARTLQGVGLFADLTVRENVMVGAQRFRRSGVVGAMLARPRADRDERALSERALAALERVGCDDMAESQPGPAALCRCRSGSALARALACEPDLLLLDEPAGGLDSEELSALADTIRSLGSSIAVMLVDHHMDLVTSVCDRMVVLDFGRVIAAGDPADGAPGPARARGLPRARGEANDTTTPSETADAQVEELTTDYGPVRAVDGVSLEAPEGTVTAVLGANGAGKTSLLRTITGLVPPRSGRVMVDGADITGMAVEEIVRRGVAHVPEGRGVISELTVEENLRLGGLWRRSARGAARRDLRDVPAAGRARAPACLAPVGRRAPDAVDRPRADGPPAGAAARRALAGPGARDRRPDHGDDPLAGRQPRAGGAAGRAERAQRPVDRQPRDRAQPGARRRRPRAGRARRRRAPAPRLPGVLGARP